MSMNYNKLWKQLIDRGMYKKDLQQAAGLSSNAIAKMGKGGDVSTQVLCKICTIILGDNTFGKTTLLQAFNWCFYGKVNFDQRPDFLLNYEVAGEMRNGDRQLVEVQITVLHDGTEYFITRSQRYTCAGNNVKGESVPTIKVSYKQEDGQTEPVKGFQVDNVINNILPEDLSSYFFFDTERVNSISTRKDVAEAVKGLLGLSIMDSAIHHLGDKGKRTTVIGKIYGSMDLDGDAKAQEALNRIQTAEEKRAAIKEQLDDCDSQINQYEARKEQLDAILRDNQTTAALQKKKEDLERRIALERRALADTTAAYFGDFNAGALPFFAQPLLSTASAFLKEVKVDDKGIRDLTKPTISLQWLCLQKQDTYSPQPRNTITIPQSGLPILIIKRMFRSLRRTERS